MSNKNYYPPIRRSRVNQHAKRRKINFILNILIGVVFITIIVVGWNVLFGGNDGSEQASGQPTEENNQDVGVEEPDENQSPSTEDNEGIEDGDDQEPEQSEGNGENQNPETDIEDENPEDITENPGDQQELITEESDDPNVIQTVVNPQWEPVGTVQTGDHVTKYDKGTVDRTEMETALAYAVNINGDNMIVWWLQRGEVPNRDVIGTISTRDQDLVYRIYLTWVDGQGWKPTKYEELKENDKKPN